ncbi:unnamed protein product, partial [Meganyctiphanes norvegica]
TIIFIVIPFLLVIIWNLYIHNKRETAGLFRFLFPLAPLLALIENTYCQMVNWRNKDDSKEDIEKAKNNNSTDEAEKEYRKKQDIQRETAISNVLEVAIESTSQMCLQMWILCTRYLKLT